MWPKPNINDFRSKGITKMLNLSKLVTDRFLKKGFTPEEIPELLFGPQAEKMFRHCPVPLFSIREKGDDKSRQTLKGVANS
jgi:hypothetical protein